MKWHFERFHDNGAELEPWDCKDPSNLYPDFLDDIGSIHFVLVKYIEVLLYFLYSTLQAQIFSSI